MAAPESSPLQSFYRLVIMAGSAVVGGMALQVYGPPPEKLGPMIDRAKAVAADLAGQALATLNGSSDQPNAATPGSVAPSPAASSPSGSLISDAPAALFEPSSSAPSTAPPHAVSQSNNYRSTSVRAAVADDPSLEPLVARLEQSGVEQLELAAWGADGRLVRGSCTAPRPGSVFRAMLDVIDTSPRGALEGLLSGLRAGEAIAQAY